MSNVIVNKCINGLILFIDFNWYTVYKNTQYILFCYPF